MKDKTTAGLLGIFLGTFGAHKFYLGEAGSGCGYLALSMLIFPLPMFLGLIEGLQLLGMTQDDFDRRYNAPLQKVQPQPAVPLGQPVMQTRSRDWYRHVRPRSTAEQEQVVLAMIHDTGGSATPADVALHTQLSLQQARDVLNDMELLGVCRTEYDPETGSTRYTFPELSRRRATGSEDESVENYVERRGG